MLVSHALRLVGKSNEEKEDITWGRMKIRKENRGKREISKYVRWGEKGEGK